MATISKPNTFSAGASIIASEHNSNFDIIYNDYNGNVTNANISASAAIADTKLDQISTASKVAGDALTDLANIPSGAGAIPGVNLSASWPIGSVYINATDNTNPATLLGFGTWTAFGAGRVMVGFDSGDTDFDAAEETGGSKTVNLAHTHGGATGTPSDTSFATGDGGTGVPATTHTHTISSAGSATQTIVQPYIVVYMFKRVS